MAKSAKTAKSARSCSPGPSRRFAMRAMEQCAHFAPARCGGSLLDVSRLFGLTLRPSAPVYRCPPEFLDTREAGNCAGSRA